MWQTSLLIAFAVSKATSQNNQIARPLSIPPSEFWDGNDGQWSTFFLDIGTPFQRVQLLPSTSATAGDSIWIVIPQGCSLANPQLNVEDCTKSRGGIFTTNLSTTWTNSRLGNQGLYTLTTLEESMLGLEGSALYGFDTISLGAGLPTLQNQIIAGFAVNDFWLGSLGLSPLPINFTSYNQPVPSLLGSLRNMSLVLSTTWAYTAGAVYKEPPVFGSLTFGGYDENRLQDNGVSIGFWTDQSRDLLVGLQSITFDTIGSSPLLAEGIYTYIDSLVTHLWLPLNVCEAFESNFGLVWDDNLSLYLLNATIHANLRAQNPSFTFTLGASDSGGNFTTITLPYSAFDLNITTPNGTLPYFPLKRAQNSTQYTLGRVFLQEAYVIADYDRKNFTVAQAAFPARSEQTLLEIYPPGFIIETRPTLSDKAIVGTAIGGFVILTLIIGAAFWITKIRRTKKQNDDEKIQEDPGNPGAASGYKHELNSEQTKSELLVTEIHRRSELFAGGAERGHSYELPSYEIVAAELESPTRENTFKTSLGTELQHSSGIALEMEPPAKLHAGSDLR